MASVFADFHSVADVARMTGKVTAISAEHVIELDDAIQSILVAARQVADTAHEIEFPSMPTKALVGRQEIQNLIDALAEAKEA